ncbi:P27 family phage terminase small subunit [Streptomyces sp. NBC_00654]|uniref:P27 family phage terminase small subunit n=1 Tax=Streptomyces sp. NBC_00654 TaxID=2975799 RepID=UPI002250E766|nr:P27 family phage terminase small subunit [Streptomyces sp. NBC_00654]MCX4964254.1 P27 family phage terminase small subunit [Streptomyces sp. NBC_00654]
MADPRRKKPALQVIREGNAGKRPVPDSTAVPPSDLTEPDWRETFRTVDDPKREAVNTRCRAVASREWQRVVPVLKLAVGLGEVDTTVLKDYCISAARIDQCDRELSENGLLVQGERGWQKNGATTIAGQYRTQLGRYIRELDLSPSARTAITTPEPDADDSDVWD